MIKLAILLFIIILIVLFVLILLQQKKEISFKNTISGIILLKENPIFNPAMIEKELATRYKIIMKKRNANDGIAIFSNEQCRIVIVAVNAEIPPDEIEAVCKISHLWKDAQKHASKHHSHIILTLSTDNTDPVERNLLFTRIATTILRNTKSIGIYLSNQSIIAPTEQYLEITDKMSNVDLPLANWIYFGLRESNQKRSGFTIGLKEFGFREIELSDSEKTFDEIYKIIYDLSLQVLRSRQPFKKEETIELSETEEISLEERAGEFRDTDSMHIVVLEKEKNNTDSMADFQSQSEKKNDKREGL